MKPNPELGQKNVVVLVWTHFTHDTIQIRIVFCRSCHRVPFQLHLNLDGSEFLLYQPTSYVEPKKKFMDTTKEFTKKRTHYNLAIVAAWSKLNFIATAEKWPRENGLREL